MASAILWLVVVIANILRILAYMQVVLQKPLGLKFARGNDGCAYVVQNNPDLGSTDEAIEVGAE